VSRSKASPRTRKPKANSALHRGGVEWTDREHRVLERHYARLAPAEIRARYLPHRTIIAIRERAGKLHLRRPRPAAWTTHETQLLERYYHTLPAGEFSRRYLPHRSREAILLRARRLGLRKRTERAWTGRELAAVRRHFMRPGGLKHLSRALGRTEKVIDSKARALGLARRRDTHWSAAEVATLRRLYPMQGSATRITERTPYAVAARARKLGVHRQHVPSAWSSAERAILRRYPHRRPPQLMTLLPGRSRNAIVLMRRRMGDLPGDFRTS